MNRLGNGGNPSAFSFSSFSKTCNLSISHQPYTGIVYHVLKARRNTTENGWTYPLKASLAQLSDISVSFSKIRLTTEVPKRRMEE
jgi:hypothetical protein